MDDDLKEEKGMDDEEYRASLVSMYEKDEDLDLPRWNSHRMKLDRTSLHCLFDASLSSGTGISLNHPSVHKWMSEAMDDDPWFSEVKGMLDISTTFDWAALVERATRDLPKSPNNHNWTLDQYVFAYDSRSYLKTHAPSIGAELHKVWKNHGVQLAAHKTWEEKDDPSLPEPELAEPNLAVFDSFVFDGGYHPSHGPGHAITFECIPGDSAIVVANSGAGSYPAAGHAGSVNACMKMTFSRQKLMWTAMGKILMLSNGIYGTSDKIKGFFQNAQSKVLVGNIQPKQLAGSCSFYAAYYWCIMKIGQRKPGAGADNDFKVERFKKLVRHKATTTLRYQLDDRVDQMNSFYKDIAVFVGAQTYVEDFMHHVSQPLHAIVRPGFTDTAPIQRMHMWWQLQEDPKVPELVNADELKYALPNYIILLDMWLHPSRHIPGATITLMDSLFSTLGRGVALGRTSINLPVQAKLNLNNFFLCLSILRRPEIGWWLSPTGVSDIQDPEYVDFMATVIGEIMIEPSFDAKAEITEPYHVWFDSTRLHVANIFADKDNQWFYTNIRQSSSKQRKLIVMRCMSAVSATSVDAWEINTLMRNKGDVLWAAGEGVAFNAARSLLPFTEDPWVVRARKAARPPLRFPRNVNTFNQSAMLGMTQDCTQFVSAMQQVTSPFEFREAKRRFMFPRHDWTQGADVEEQTLVLSDDSIAALSPVAATMVALFGDTSARDRLSTHRANSKFLRTYLEFRKTRVLGSHDGWASPEPWEEVLLLNIAQLLRVRDLRHMASRKYTDLGISTLSLARRLLNRPHHLVTKVSNVNMNHPGPEILVHFSDLSVQKMVIPWPDTLRTYTLASTGDNARLFGTDGLVVTDWDTYDIGGSKLLKESTLRQTPFIHRQLLDHDVVMLDNGDVWLLSEKTEALRFTAAGMHLYGKVYPYYQGSDPLLLRWMHMLPGTGVYCTEDPREFKLLMIKHEYKYISKTAFSETYTTSNPQLADEWYVFDMNRWTVNVSKAEAKAQRHFWATMITMGSPFDLMYACRHHLAQTLLPKQAISSGGFGTCWFVYFKHFTLNAGRLAMKVANPAPNLPDDDEHKDPFDDWTPDWADRLGSPTTIYDITPADDIRQRLSEVFEILKFQFPDDAQAQVEQDEIFELGMQVHVSDLNRRMAALPEGIMASEMSPTVDEPVLNVTRRLETRLQVPDEGVDDTETLMMTPFTEHVWMLSEGYVHGQPRFPRNRCVRLSAMNRFVVLQGNDDFLCADLTTLPLRTKDGFAKELLAFVDQRSCIASDTWLGGVCLDGRILPQVWNWETISVLRDFKNSQVTEMKKVKATKTPEEAGKLIYSSLSTKYDWLLDFNVSPPSSRDTYVGPMRTLRQRYFEMLFGGYASPTQQRIVDRLYNSITGVGKYKVVQMVMGGGKTSFVLPLLVFLITDHPVIVVLPDHMVDETMNKLHLTMAPLLRGTRRMHLIPRIKRGSRVNLPKNNNDVVVLSDGAFKVLRLNQPNIPTLARAVVIVDEFDSVFAPISSTLNFPQGQATIVRDNLQKVVGVDPATVTHYIENSMRLQREQEPLPYAEGTTEPVKEIIALARVGNVNRRYGFSHKEIDHRYAIPYIHNQRPREGSEFTDIALRIFRTINTHMHENQPSFHDVKYCVDAIAAALRTTGNKAAAMKDVFGLIITDTQVQEVMAGIQVNVDKVEISDMEQYLKNYVLGVLVPKIKVYTSRGVCSFIEALDWTRRVIAFSGTVNIRLAKQPPERIGYVQSVAGDSVEEAKILAALLNVINGKGSNEAIPVGTEKECLAYATAEENNHYNCLIDAGGTVVSFATVEFVQKELAPAANRTVVYWEDAVRMMFDPKTKVASPFNGTKKALTYFDETHTIGTDTKQLHDARALILVNSNTTYESLAQASFRMRGLLASQSVDFYWVLGEEEKVPDNPVFRSDVVAMCKAFTVQNSANSDLVGYRRNLVMHMRKMQSKRNFMIKPSFIETPYNKYTSPVNEMNYWMRRVAVLRDDNLVCELLNDIEQNLQSQQMEAEVQVMVQKQKQKQKQREINTGPAVPRTPCMHLRYTHDMFTNLQGVTMKPLVNQWLLSVAPILFVNGGDRDETRNMEIPWLQELFSKVPMNLSVTETGDVVVNSADPNVGPEESMCSEQLALAAFIARGSSAFRYVRERQYLYQAFENLGWNRATELIDCIEQARGFNILNRVRWALVPKTGSGAVRKFFEDLLSPAKKNANQAAKDRLLVQFAMGVNTLDISAEITSGMARTIRSNPGCNLPI